MAVDFKCRVAKVTTSLNKQGDVIGHVRIEFNLTQHGEFTLITDLVTLQDQNVDCTLEGQQITIQEAAGKK